jgi:hypothetical protein
MVKANDEETAMGWQCWRGIITPWEISSCSPTTQIENSWRSCTTNSKADMASAGAKQAANEAERATVIAETAQQEAKARMKKAEALEARQIEMAVTLSKLKGLVITEHSAPKSRYTAENSIFLVSISQLRAFYRMSKTRDPVEVVSKLLFAADV